MRDVLDELLGRDIASRWGNGGRPTAVDTRIHHDATEVAVLNAVDVR